MLFALSATALSGCFFFQDGLVDVVADMAAPRTAPPDLAMDSSIVADLAMPARPDGDMTWVPVVLAPPGDTAQMAPVDGISCDANEMLLFHIHAHVAVYVEGQQRLIPAGIGIGPPLVILGDGEVAGGTCYSWLHTHDQSGVIHIESPIQRVFTLGNLFDIWGLTLTANRVGPVMGAVHAYLNGQAFMGDPNTIPLDAHNVIQLNVGNAVVAPLPFTFADGL